MSNINVHCHYIYIYDGGGGGRMAVIWVLKMAQPFIDDNTQ